MESVEQIWRAFEPIADCTVFQNFDLLVAWQRSLGAETDTMPLPVVIRHRAKIIAILPLSIEGGAIRRLTWLAQDFCDYPGPLLHRDFSDIVAREKFPTLWREVLALIAKNPKFAPDLVVLRKMLRTVGTQKNPFTMLPSLPHASGAYVATLRGDWEAFHRSRRSAKARRQDRAKLKRLRQHGEVSLAMPRDRVEMESAIDALLAQRSKTFARKGIGNKFSRAGFRNLLVALASGPQTRSMVHISRLDVGGRPAALNFGLQYRGRYLLCLVSYDEKLSRESPGALHLTELIRRAVNLGMQEFDFLVGHQRLKAEWSDHRRALLDHIAAVNLRGWPVAVLARAFGRLKRAIKNSNTSWEVYLRLRRFGPALIRALRRD